MEDVERMWVFEPAVVSRAAISLHLGRVNIKIVVIVDGRLAI